MLRCVRSPACLQTARNTSCPTETCHCCLSRLARGCAGLRGLASLQGMLPDSALASARDVVPASRGFFRFSMRQFFGGGCLPRERVRAISTARLCTLPCLHLRPIDVLVSDGPVWRSYLEGGFVLRCFQHLSWPDAATRRCSRRNNRLTGGRSDTVLSY